MQIPIAVANPCTTKGFGFPNRIGRFQGHKEQEQYIRKMYDRKATFMKKHNLPIWNGTPPRPNKVGIADGRQANSDPSMSAKTSTLTGRFIMTSDTTCSTANWPSILTSLLVSDGRAAVQNLG